jgi:hypothetical protein
MRTSTTSGRLNSGGGYSPLASISRTFVPLKKTCARLVRAGLGGRHPAAVQTEEGVLEEERRYLQLPGSNSSKMCWAS